MQGKNESLTFHDIFYALRPRLRRWMRYFLAAAVCVLIGCSFARDRRTVSAVVNFSYNGIEFGLDPSGNRFDEMEMKDESLIRLAAEAMGADASPESAERLRSALDIKGVIPDDAFDSVITYESIFGEDNAGTEKNVRDAAYYPSSYTLTFHYKEAGFSARQGVQFLRELLSAYERFFYDHYGYNQSLGSVLSSMDYREYEYITAVEVLDNRLLSLRAYLQTFVSQDNTRFVSERTGYSFSDLIDSIDTIRTQDINWITSYIIKNNVTKERKKLINYYTYIIEDAGRELAQRQSRLYALTEQIEGYVKTNAIFVGVPGSAGQDGSTASYEFPQQSAMYNTLINQKVSCETAISETQERISMYERRVERLESEGSPMNEEIVEADLKKIDDKVTQCLADTAETTDEFFRAVYLKRSFQIIKEPESTGFSAGQIFRDAFPALEMAEAVLLGLFILSMPGAALTLKRKRESTETTFRAGSENAPIKNQDGEVSCR